MKMLSSLAVVAIAMGVSFTNLQADASHSAKSVDGVKTIVIVWATDPNGQYSCVTTEYNDGSDCVIVDREGSTGLWASSACGPTYRR